MTATLKLSALSMALLSLVFATDLKAADPANAEVTFYSNGSRWTEGLPGAKHASFDGAIFDGKQRLFVIRHGHFITLNLASGPHTFSASYSGKHPAENSQLVLDLVQGESYFVRAESESSGDIAIAFQKGRLDPVICQTANQQAETTRPVEDKHVSPGMKSRMVATMSIPLCR